MDFINMVKPMDNIITPFFCDSSANDQTRLFKAFLPEWFFRIAGVR